jgi:hypothetical protein
LTTNPAVRSPGSAFGATLNVTPPSPCPEAGPTIVNHAASLRTDHPHSLFVVIVNAPDPPPTGKDDAAACACTAQRADGVGAVAVSEDDPQEVTQQAKMSNAMPRQGTPSAPPIDAGGNPPMKHVRFLQGLQDLNRWGGGRGLVR